MVPLRHAQTIDCLLNWFIISWCQNFKVVERLSYKKNKSEASLGSRLHHTLTTQNDLPNTRYDSLLGLY